MVGGLGLRCKMMWLWSTSAAWQHILLNVQELFSGRPPPSSC
jgi:hypothetical protein